MPESRNPQRSWRAALSYPDFTLYQSARLLIGFSQAMQSVAVGWQVYEITKRPLDLGLVGLAQFLPGILLFLVSGHVADRFDRRRLYALCCAGYAVCSSLLLFLIFRGNHSVYPIYLVLVLLGVVRSFSWPLGQALLPQLVREEHFPNAVALGATVTQTAMILGPAIGGVIYAFSRGPSAVYGTAAAASLGAMMATLRIRSRAKPRPPEQVSLTTVLAGLRYIWTQRLILGTISLDLFAVLLGGAVALLPVYAREILDTGPWGLGLLRSAPGVGAAAMAFLMAHRPLRGHAGATMLWCVAGFGFFTILFGISRSFPLSLLALLLVGATDMVSLIIRSTMVQLATRDEMRGRVGAVNMLFIGASNELGEFESGVTAAWFGTVPAVVLGGVGTLLVAAVWAWRFPEIRQSDRFSGPAN
ncbi:MAG: MFS transporter [Acidobacteriia bacterium]|nr:MFS transporter [Terriglobia bacterium]